MNCDGITSAAGAGLYSALMRGCHGAAAPRWNAVGMQLEHSFRHSVGTTATCGQGAICAVGPVYDYASL